MSTRKRSVGASPHSPAAAAPAPMGGGGEEPVAKRTRSSASEAEAEVARPAAPAAGLSEAVLRAIDAFRDVQRLIRLAKTMESEAQIARAEANIAAARETAETAADKIDCAKFRVWRIYVPRSSDFCTLNEPFARNVWDAMIASAARAGGDGEGLLLDWGYKPPASEPLRGENAHVLDALDMHVEVTKARGLIKDVRAVFTVSAKKDDTGIYGAFRTAAARDAAAAAVTLEGATVECGVSSAEQAKCSSLELAFWSGDDYARAKFDYDVAVSLAHTTPAPPPFVLPVYDIETPARPPIVLTAAQEAARAAVLVRKEAARGRPSAEFLRARAAKFDADAVAFTKSVDLERARMAAACKDAKWVVYTGVMSRFATASEARARALWADVCAAAGADTDPAQIDALFRAGWVEPRCIDLEQADVASLAECGALPGEDAAYASFVKDAQAGLVVLADCRAPEEGAASESAFFRTLESANAAMAAAHAAAPTRVIAAVRKGFLGRSGKNTAAYDAGDAASQAALVADIKAGAEKPVAERSGENGASGVVPMEMLLRLIASAMSQ